MDRRSRSLFLSSMCVCIKELPPLTWMISGRRRLWAGGMERLPGSSNSGQQKTHILGASWQGCFPSLPSFFSALSRNGSGPTQDTEDSGLSSLDSPWFPLLSTQKDHQCPRARPFLQPLREKKSPNAWATFPVKKI